MDNKSIRAGDEFKCSPVTVQFECMCVWRWVGVQKSDGLRKEAVTVSGCSALKQQNLLPEAHSENSPWLGCMGSLMILWALVRQRLGEMSWMGESKFLMIFFAVLTTLHKLPVCSFTTRQRCSLLVCSLWCLWRKWWGFLIIIQPRNCKHCCAVFVNTDALLGTKITLSFICRPQNLVLLSTSPVTVSIPILSTVNDYLLCFFNVQDQVVCVTLLPHLFHLHKCFHL